MTLGSLQTGFFSVCKGVLNYLEPPTGNSCDQADRVNRAIDKIFAGAAFLYGSAIPLSVFVPQVGIPFMLITMVGSSLLIYGVKNIPEEQTRSL